MKRVKIPRGNRRCVRPACFVGESRSLGGLLREGKSTARPIFLIGQGREPEYLHDDIIKINLCGRVFPQGDTYRNSAVVMDSLRPFFVFNPKTSHESEVQ